MSDIYEHKARKYKYKYKILKQEYISEGGTSKVLEGGADEFEGGFGCVSIPPISLEGLNYVKLYSDYNYLNLDIFNTGSYVGKFMSCADDVFIKEFDNLLLIKKKNWDPTQYTQQLYFACTINYNSLINHLKKQEKIKLESCINKKYKNYKNNNHTKDIQNINICYLITNKVGTSFYILFKETPNIIYSNIIPILTSLMNGIYYFIDNLYKEQYYLGDINTNNMTYDVDVKKVYFIDFGLMHINTDIKHINSVCLNTNYSLVIKKFFDCFEFDQIEKNKNIVYNKNDVIKGLIINDTKFDNERIEFFNNLQYNNYKNMYNNYVENILFSSWNDINTMTAYDIYKDYIFPIVKNTDIYALSLFIYQIVQNKSLVIKLLNDAIENKINSPRDLIKRLNNIIEQLSSSSINVSAQPLTPPTPPQTIRAQPPTPPSTPPSTPPQSIMIHLIPLLVDEQQQTQHKQALSRQQQTQQALSRQHQQAQQQAQQQAHSRQQQALSRQHQQAQQQRPQQGQSQLLQRPQQGQQELIKKLLQGDCRENEILLDNLASQIFSINDFHFYNYLYDIYKKKCLQKQVLPSPPYYYKR